MEDRGEDGSSVFTASGRQWLLGWRRNGDGSASSLTQRPVRKPRLRCREVDSNFTRCLIWTSQLDAVFDLNVTINTIFICRVNSSGMVASANKGGFCSPSSDEIASDLMSEGAMDTEGAEDHRLDTELPPDREKHVGNHLEALDLPITAADGGGVRIWERGGEGSVWWCKACVCRRPS